MILSVQSKIMLTVFSIVLLFALFILFYYPARQERMLLENYNTEILNYSNTVALGVKIALMEENFEGVEMALDIVRDDKRLNFVSLLQYDSVLNANTGRYVLKKSVFMTYPEDKVVAPEEQSSPEFVIKSSPFKSPIMNGEIMLSFSTAEIDAGRRQIRNASMIASLVVFIIGLLIGYWLAKNISIPVLELRDAANKVGEGDLTQAVVKRSGDEIGELGIAFNKMVRDLGSARMQINKRNVELSAAKQKSDELLLNILPEETADELKRTGKAKAQDYKSVSVLFTDFKDFTPISEKMSANQLVDELNYCFSKFDQIISKYHIEKIKTIGDAYMCVAGLPVETSTHASDSVNAALEILEFIVAYKKEKIEEGEVGFDIRIGIHTGPVVAGIVGLKKFAYDIWGSTVNIAARCERSSEPNKINITSEVYEMVKDTHHCTPRGEIELKGLGKLPMYFVNGVK